jgi:hypothetical protein
MSFHYAHALIEIGGVFGIAGIAATTISSI